jgi:ergothioneine biosynthesis protein EgtB
MHARTDPASHRSQPSTRPDESSGSLQGDFESVRGQTLALCATLPSEDLVVQSMPDASPAKWHLAHTTWFFERFVLRDACANYAPHDERYEFLFNSYYETVGARHPRAERGMLTRPTVDEVRAYRAHVDERLRELFESSTLDAAIATRIELGLHHEQQHQELLLTDLKHAFSLNPLQPAYCPATPRSVTSVSPLEWTPVSGGLHEIGTDSESFSFDNERPRHRVYLMPFVIANRLVTNGEFRDFIADGGYENPQLWLADGWAIVKAQQWRHPLYWSEALDTEFTLSGRRAIDDAEPVCHVSYYEADAFARWADARLPTEAEWEVASRGRQLPGNFLESGRMHPAPAAPDHELQQMLGTTWEWTASAYLPYPGFRPDAGAIGEYNGKFMANQFVLRGGSCVTPESHIRRSYRNFFYPHQRWQFMGLRLAKDV